MYHGKGSFLCCTTLWSKTYFIFVSTRDHLQREHYWSSFRLLPSSGFLFLFSPFSLSFSFTVMSFCGSVKALRECEGSYSHTMLIQSRLERWKRNEKPVTGICSYISAGLGCLPRKRPTITFWVPDTTRRRTYHWTISLSSLQDPAEKVCRDETCFFK